MQIRLGTLNAWALPEPLASDVSSRIDAIGKKLPDYDLDVVACQEVWTRQARRVLQRAGARAGLIHAWAGDDHRRICARVLRCPLPRKSIFPAGKPRICSSSNAGRRHNSIVAGNDHIILCQVDEVENAAQSRVHMLDLGRDRTNLQVCSA